MKRNRGKQQNRKDQRSQENWRYQGNISCRDGQNKGQKWQGINRSREIKKRWPEYTEKIPKKGFNDSDKNNVVPHLEPDILSAKSSGPQETPQ